MCNYPRAGLRRRKIVSIETPLWMRWITSASSGATESTRRNGEPLAPGWHRLSVAPLLAEVIQRIHSGVSVDTIFRKRSPALT